MNLLSRSMREFLALADSVRSRVFSGFPGHSPGSSAIAEELQRREVVGSYLVGFLQVNDRKLGWWDRK